MLSKIKQSVYLRNRKRTPVSPPGCYAKCIVDADACDVMWVHRCLVFTASFAHRQVSSSAYSARIQRLYVDDRDALKHHYRFDSRDTFTASDVCPHMNESVLLADDVMSKYGDELIVRLSN